MTTTRVILLLPEPPGQLSPWPIEARVQIRDLPSDSVWKACQKLVEGYIEIVHLTPYEPTPENEGAPFSQGWHLSAYVNEDGIALGMSPCAKTARGQLLFGPVVIVHERVDGQGDTFYRDVTEDDWNRVTQIVRAFIPHRKEATP